MSETRRRFGWTCRFEATQRNGKTYHYWRAYKRIKGRVRSVYIGRDWSRATLAAFRVKVQRVEGGEA